MKMNKKTLNIYLSGSIKKGENDSRNDSNYWSPEHEAKIVQLLGEFNVNLLNPSKTIIKRNDYYANYGCDLYLVSISDIVLVDLREEKGIGVGAEMMFALYNSIPCIGWLPRNSHYRRDLVPGVFGEDLKDWIHPFAYGLTQGFAETLEESVEMIYSIIRGKTNKESKPASLAIDYFRNLYPNVEFYKG